MKPNLSRRTFAYQISALGAAFTAWANNPLASAEESLHLATNEYSWSVFYNRNDKNFQENLDAGFKEVASCGINGFEPGVGSPENLDSYLPLLEKHGLEMRSIYVNSVLHDEEKVEQSIGNVLAIGEKAKKAGTEIIVTNPSPIQWGKEAHKSDEQLIRQAEALNRLGQGLNQQGLILAYHNHDIELRNAAREFHHMMVGTDPQYVTLCLDAHWIYRGAGNSNVALHDIVELYGDRIREMHLRQSSDGVWKEIFSEGDIDYQRLADQIDERRKKPHLVLEQAVENGTLNTMNAAEAHKKSVKFARKVFSKFR